MIAKKMALIALTAVLLNGCSGLKFKDEKVNLSLPDDFRFRTPIKNTADLRFFMKENVGLLITPDGSSGAYKILAKPIVADDFQAREEIIKDGTVYSSKITQGASAQGGYLSFAAGLSAEQAIEYRIVDISRVDVPWGQLPDAKIRAAAATPNPSGIKRLWIQSLILSRALSQSYSELKCNASGSGPAFQTSGKCFNATSTESNDYAIGAVLLDIDEYVKNSPSVAATPGFKSLLDRLQTMSSLKVYDRQKESSLEKPKFIRVQPEITEIQGIVRD